MEDDKDKRILELEHRIAELESKSSGTASTRSDDCTETNPEALGRQYNVSSKEAHPLSAIEPVHELSPNHIERYSRQMILSNGFGVHGQLSLLSSSVLIIGAGGIGSTVILYLAASGIGRMGIVDFDVVEVSNLHRQVIHTTQRVGWNKAVSACYSVQQLNPSANCLAYNEEVTHENVERLVSSYDCIVDCSDNPRTRYLINDACVLVGKPLVSGSAVGTEGQLTVYNSTKKEQSPCYRCLYPRPSATGQCRACSDAGVLGPVPGLIGILQSMEVIKLLTGEGDTMDRRLLMYDSMSTNFMNIKKPPKQPKCPVCGPNATIKNMIDSRESLLTADGPRRIAAPSQLPDSLQVTCQEYHKIRESQTEHILLDVRVKTQFDLCALPGSVHIPMAELVQQLEKVEGISKGKLPIFCLCRRGVDSVEAVRVLQEARPSHPGIHSVQNIRGGLDQWRQTVNPAFPKY
uniref:Adenylyltransferase and sulfurtransferase MOCS3 homolog n=1 Tax=Entomoneis paludosa TaxID=265537 RepID=A0A7S3DSI5_9STRA